MFSCLFCAQLAKAQPGKPRTFLRRRESRVLRRCREAGVVFQPIIFESFGGVSAEAERVIKCLNKAVAVNNDTSEQIVATQFWHRVGVDLLRANCRAFHRRLVGRDGHGEVGAGPIGDTVDLQVVGRTYAPPNGRFPHNFICICR